MTSKRLRIILIAMFTVGALGIQPANAYNSNSVLPTWANSATIYEVNIRQYTEAGTFKAFEASLPRLQKLGVKILWLMPIHPISELNRKGSLGSPYSVANYKGINPEFGNEADFRSLMTKAHALGFKVILDWVANHSGWDNPWTANKSWYHTDGGGNIVPPNNDWVDVAWLNYKNQDMRRAMIDAMAYWVKTFDIDGFRADVAAGVPTDFWKQANTQLQAIKPLFMLAEDQSVQSLLDDAFIANYNWELKDLVKAIADGNKGRADLEAMATNQSFTYPTRSFPMNFITNHDENSWSGTEFDRLGAAVSAMAALTFTYPGMPLIYSGQEVGNTKRLAFFEKDFIPGLTVANSTTALYTKLVSLKTKNAALWNNSTAKLISTPGDNNSVIAYSRTSGINKVLTVINATNTVQKVTLNLTKLNAAYYLFSTGKSTTLKTTLTLTLKPWQYEIYSSAKA
ncbi:MAG: alpha-amylase [Actinobacteria bacterium]|nr:alpha-amylase [Actinomycetota bacterium]